MRLFKGVDRLVEIGAGAKPAHDVALVIQLAIEIAAAAAADRRLDRRQAGARAGGQAGGQAGGRAGQRVIVDGLPDQAPVRGLLGGQGVAGEGQTQRPRLTDQTRQMIGAASVRDQADGGERLNEFGAARG